MSVIGAVTAIGFGLVVVPWLLYPAFVFAFAAMRGTRSTRAGQPRSGAHSGTVPSSPTVTCVLATRDPPDVVRERVANFLAQDYPSDRLSVVVAVDATAAGSLLPALAPLGEDGRVTVIRGDAPGGKCPALNAAVRAAAGDVLLFSDARQRFAPDVAAKLAGALVDDPRLAITSGRLLLPSDAAGSSLFRLYSRLELNLRAAEARLHSAVGVSGSVYAMWRQYWTPLPAGLILDDLYVPMRLALERHRVGFVADAYAHETRHVAAAQEFKRKVRTLTGNYQLCAWLPGVLLPWRNPIWLQFVCHKLLRLLMPVGVLLAGLGVGLMLARAATARFGYGALWLAAVAVTGGIWVVAGRDARATRLRGIALQFASMQAAVVVAAVHGLRGEWDVWKA